MMGLMEDNMGGYTHARMDRDDIVENLRNRKFLIVRGIADDNAHNINAMHFSKVAQRLAVHIEEVVSCHLVCMSKKNNPFLFLQNYVDQHHLLSDVRKDFYQRLEIFYDQCFA